MELRFTRDGDFGILSISGNIGRLTTRALREHLQQVAEQACPYMIVDLSGVEKLSVSGLGLIFAGKSRLDDMGTPMALVGPVRQLNRFLPPDSMMKMIPLCENVERAKIALRKMAFDRRAKTRRRTRQPR